MDKFGSFRKIFNFIGENEEIDKIESFSWLYFEREFYSDVKVYTELTA